jgi:hypothetical protein
MVTTAILGPVLTQHFAPRMLEHIEIDVCSSCKAEQLR